MSVAPRLRMSAFLSLLFALAITTPAKPAAVVEKVPVFLQFSADDKVGAAYVDKLRDALESSSGYRSVSSPSDAQFVIAIVTMDPTEADLGSGAGQSTVASVTLQVENTKGLNYMVYSWVLVANREKIDSLATGLFSAIDKEIRDLKAQVAP
jgi:hypothetical protein